MMTIDVYKRQAYNHMAIYLRWCMEHDLMGEEFLAEYGEVVEKVKADSASVDLREFIRDELDGCLFSVLFNHQGRAFAGYYYGEMCIRDRRNSVILLGVTAAVLPCISRPA